MLSTQKSSSRLQLAIIADDLTGALDAAAPFAGRGLATIVVANPSDLEEALAEAPAVLSVSTRSREITPDDAMREVARVVEALPSGVRLFKKVDSRLKGNIEAELSALPSGRLLVLPAIPEFGRVVRGGGLEGFGVEKPVPIAAALGRHAARAAIPDTGTREEMAKALAAAGDALLVGARGLAEAMAATLPEGPVGCDLPPQRRATFVVGSRDPITLAQVEALRRAHPDLLHIEAPNGLADRQNSAGEAPPITLLQAVPGEAPASGKAVAAALAESLCHRCLAGRNMLLLTGGATAETVLEALAIRRMRLFGEFLPGMPVAQAGRLVLITKSGGFGAPDALQCVADAVGATWEVGR